MNLNELWAGYDYAYYEWKRKNEPYRRNAPRVKVIRAFKRRQYGNERASGMVEVMLLEDDGTPKLDVEGNQRIRTVRARDIAMLWEQYEDEREHREAERERIAREQEEHEAEEQRRRQELVAAMQERWGIDPNWIYNVTESGIHLSRWAIERELGVDVE